MVFNNLLLVLSGPSGTGKGTVIKSLMKEKQNMIVLPSVTTREPREGEIEGINYYFASKEKFKEMISKDKFVEWVEYCGNYYGTLRRKLEDSLKTGVDIILEKEVRGAVEIKKQYPDCASIFLLPPNFRELKRRISKRGTEDIVTIEKRLNIALEEISYTDSYDYVVVNHCIEKTVKSINCIIQAERLKVKRNLNILKGIVL